MALIIYMYRFKDSSKLHLAAELTSVDPGDVDGCDNYISYYCLRKVSIEKAGMNNVPDQKTGCLHYGAQAQWSQRPEILRELGFDHAPKKYDLANLILLDRVIIPASSNESAIYNECAIELEWAEFRNRNYTLFDRERHDHTQGKNFDIKSRHCGTIIKNILEKEEFCKAIPEKVSTITNEVITASLKETFNHARHISKTYCGAESDEKLNEYYLKTDVLLFCKYYQHSKFLREPGFYDEKHYKYLLSLCGNLNSGWIHASKINQIPLMKKKLSEYLNQYGKMSSDQKRTHSLILSLADYKEKREKEWEYHGLGRLFPGNYSKTDKLVAVNKIILLLSEKTFQPLTEKEKAALFDPKDRLYRDYICPYGKDFLVNIIKNPRASHSESIGSSSPKL